MGAILVGMPFDTCSGCALIINRGKLVRARQTIAEQDEQKEWLESKSILAAIPHGVVQIDLLRLNS
jgi:hypothetical protein